MSARPLPAHRTSIAEFRRLVERSEKKYEFFDGEVFEWEMMAGTSDEHSVVCNNVQVGLTNAFRKHGTKCVTLPSDAYLAIPNKRYYRFPDVTVQCAPPIYDEHFRLARTNPAILIEVTSERSRRPDHTSKFELYSTIPSLREYAIFEQDSPLCTVHAREDASAPWTTVAHFRLESRVHFPSVDVRVALGEFYRDIQWTEAGAKFVPGAGVPTWEEDDPGV